MIFAIFISLLLFSSPVLAEFAVVQESPTSVRATWTANTESDLAGYKLYRGQNPGQYDVVVTIDKSQTSHTVTGLVTGETYYFALRAFDTAGEHSPFTNEVRLELVPAADRKPMPPEVVAFQGPDAIGDTVIVEPGQDINVEWEQPAELADGTPYDPEETVAWDVYIRDVRSVGNEVEFVGQAGNGETIEFEAQIGHTYEVAITAWVDTESEKSQRRWFKVQQEFEPLHKSVKIRIVVE